MPSFKMPISFLFEVSSPLDTISYLVPLSSAASPTTYPSSPIGKGGGGGRVQVKAVYTGNLKRRSCFVIQRTGWLQTGLDDHVRNCVCPDYECGVKKGSKRYSELGSGISIPRSCLQRPKCTKLFGGFLLFEMLGRN